jgi:predicted nuclease with TOPRIM domain|tara:strand:+ start:1230 stop:1511 length:282 start_codon:yes stop_codon:yes gene_type:complete
MATKEKVIDLKPKAEKVTEEELAKLQTVVNRINSVQFRIGQMESQKHEMLHQHSQLQGQVIKLQNDLSETYGTFDVNLEDGTINYPKDGESRD